MSDNVHLRENGTIFDSASRARDVFNKEAKIWRLKEIAVMYYFFIVRISSYNNFKQLF